MRGLVVLSVACSSGLPDTGHEPMGTECPFRARAPCFEERTADLSLNGDVVRDAMSSTEVEGTGFRTSLNASGGGDIDVLDTPWVYVQIRADDWEVLPIHDFQAEQSTAWDLAIRRNQIRLNSGSSGPGCVDGLIWTDREWSETSDLPAGMIFSQEDFYTESCELVTPEVGLPNTPRLVLADWWTDAGCVAMTRIPMVVRPHRGGEVLMLVETYYGEGQEECDAGRGPGSEGGRYRFRWRWLGAAG